MKNRAPSFALIPPNFDPRTCALFWMSAEPARSSHTQWVSVRRRWYVVSPNQLLASSRLPLMLTGSQGRCSRTSDAASQASIATWKRRSSLEHHTEQTGSVLVQPQHRRFCVFSITLLIFYFSSLLTAEESTSTHHHRPAEETSATDPLICKQAVFQK